MGQYTLYLVKILYPESEQANEPEKGGLMLKINLFLMG